LVRPAGRFGGDVHTVCWWCSSSEVEEDEGERHGGEPDSALVSFLIGHILASSIFLRFKVVLICVAAASTWVVFAMQMVGFAGVYL
jgi:hypothetical protein